jgi:broad specificity phosphatase PhoE
MPPPNLAASLVAGFLTLQLALLAGASRATESDPLAELARPGRLLVLRHANAPGIGDPADFSIGDCASQRNLDAAGRRQAARLGARLREAGVARAVVYSSQWCRCLETARMLGLGEVIELPALNSFFGKPRDRGLRAARLREFLAALPTDGPPVVLVTHQVVITALTGGYAASAGGVILRLNGTIKPRLLGEIEPD